MQSLKDFVQGQLNRRGRAIVPVNSVASAERVFAVLRRHGFEPDVVFDVGVADGTPWLYDAFPRAEFHLIDPTRESAPHMESWAKKIRAHPHNCALGAAAGEVQIRTRDTIEHATIMKDMTDPDIRDTYSVEMRRFDELFPEIKGKALAKIDVEGAELEVLRGMTGVLSSIDVLIVETSLNSLYEGGADFPELLAFMRQHGMTLFDILGIKRRPFDGACHQLDAVFVQQDSPFRTKRWD